MTGHMSQDTEPTTQRRGWYYGWNIVTVLILSQVAANSLSYNAFPLFVRGWAHDLHTTVSELLLCIPALLFVAAPLSPVVGILADRHPPRRLFACGLVGMGMFYGLVSLATHAWQVIALFALAGAPALTLCSSIPANALIARWFVRRLGFALGLGAFGIGLGGIVIPPLVSAWLPDLGWRMVWRIAGLLLIVVVAPVVVFTIRNVPTEREGFHYLTEDGDLPTARAHGHAVTGAGSGLAWREVLTRRNFWILVVVYLTIMGTGSAFVQNMGPIVASRGMGDRFTGLLLAVLSAAHVVVTLLLGLAADRYGPRGPLITLALAVAGGIGLLGLMGGLPAMVLGAALIGCNSGVFTPLGAAIAAEFGPQGFGKAFGMALFFLPLATPTGYILARSQEATGSYLPVSVGFMAMLGAAALVCLLLREPHAGSVQGVP